MSFHPGLLRASAPPVCFPPPRMEGMKYFRPNDISTSHYHLVPSAPLRQSGRSAFQESGAFKRPINISVFSPLAGVLLPFVQVARLN